VISKNVSRNLGSKASGTCRRLHCMGAQWGYEPPPVPHSKIKQNRCLEVLFSGPNTGVPPPPQTPVGYDKGNLPLPNSYKMNNIRILSRYLSVNRTTPFFPLFGQKTGIFAQKLPVSGLKNAPFDDQQSREPLSRRNLRGSRVSGQVLSTACAHEKQRGCNHS
jgi:hypothetical protein